MPRPAHPINIEVVDPKLAAVLRTKTPAERAAMVADAHMTARALLAAGIRFRHADWSSAEVQAEVSRRMLRGNGIPPTAAPPS